MRAILLARATAASLRGLRLSKLSSHWEVAGRPVGRSPAGKRPTGRPAPSQWLLNLLSRKPRKLAAVALANKMARIVWAMMTSGKTYRPAPAA